MINTQWLELLMNRINFHDPKDVRAIVVLLYAFETTQYNLKYVRSVKDSHRTNKGCTYVYISSFFAKRKIIFLL